MFKIKKKEKQIKTRITLKITLLLFATSALTASVYLIFFSLLKNDNKWDLFGYLGIALGVSIIGGSFLSLLINKSTTDIIIMIANALEEVTSGNFKIRIPKSKHEFMNKNIADFNKMVKELETTTTLRNDFISTFSHEYKTPLVSIKGFAEMLLNENLSEEEQKEYLQIIYDESSRLSCLAQNVLLISKLESMEVITETITYDISEQIRQSILILIKDWEKKNIEIEVDIDDCKYFGNENLMKQVWINLLSNAIRFTKKNGKIKVTLKEEENIVITIEDNGCGMDDETKKHLFDKFYQGENSQNTGNGLGLTIVKRIIDLCGGTIEVESTINEKTIFTITLKN